MSNENNQPVGLRLCPFDGQIVLCDGDCDHCSFTEEDEKYE